MATRPKIFQKLSKYNQSSRQGNEVRYIVIHYVGAISSALNNCKYFAGGDRQSSAHFFCDKEIWQCIPLSKAAWHCGGGLQDYGHRMVEGNKGATLHGICKNANSIGIELCCTRKNGRIVPTEQSIKTAIPLVSWLMDKYDVPASRVVRHFDVTGKCCPNGYISKTAWASLHKRLTGSSSTAKPKSTEQSPVYPTVTLVYAMKGEQVKRLQRCLNKIMGTKLEIDGSFGPATEKVVKALQRRYGLAVDGMAGPKTRAKIKEVMSK